MSFDYDAEELHAASMLAGCQQLSVVSGQGFPVCIQITVQTVQCECSTSLSVAYVKSSRKALVTLSPESDKRSAYSFVVVLTSNLNSPSCLFLSEQRVAVQVHVVQLLRKSV